MSEWRETTLGEVCEVIIDNRGKNPSKYYSLEKYPVIDNFLIKNSLYPNLTEATRYIDETTFSNFIRNYLLKDDVLITLVGNGIGNVTLSPSNEVVIIQNTIGLRVIQSFYQRFLYYFLLNKKESVKNFDRGTSQPSIKKGDLLSSIIPVPPLPEQKSIADTLSSLDDKIESNNKINQTLEEMAQVIFKSWFVDFEPFQDGEFIESELGLIPKGFKVVSLEEICESVSKKHSFDEESLIFLNTGDVTKGLFHHNNEMTVTDMPGQAKKSIQFGDILYSEIRPVNEHYAYVNFDSSRYVVSTKFMVLRAKNVDSRRLYQFLTNKETIDTLQLEAIGRSGTFPQIRFENVGRLKMIIGTEQIETEFADIITGFYEIIEKNNEETQTLTEIRNTLLPKLMSGEVRVPLGEVE